MRGRGALTTPLSLAMALVVALFTSPTNAQPRKKTQKKPRKALPELRKLRNAGHDAYFHGELRIKRLGQESRRLKSKLETLNEEERKVREATWLLKPRQTQKLQQIKQKKHRVGEELAALQGQVHILTPKQEIRREELIESSSSLVERLLEVADRIWDKREDQARSYVQEAMGELRLIDDLRRLESPPPKPPQIHPIDPDAPLTDLRFRLEIYRERVKELDDYVPKLAPREKRRQQRVRHLARLLRYYRGDSARVRQTLNREREALERVMRIRRQVERYRNFYGAQIVLLEKVIKVRGPMEGDDR